MKKLLTLLFIGFAFMQCSDSDKSSCSTFATVYDLSELDGCGFVFELEDGTRLEPIRPLLFCATPPQPKDVTDDPLYNFEFVNGKRVKLSYQKTDNVSACMAGIVVKITCLEEVVGQTED